jgi:Probable cobalt transporter subunit (CbtB)
VAHAAAVQTPVSSPTPALPRVALPTISLRQLAPFLILVGLLAMLAIYFVSAEQGATSLVGGHYIHEFVHDARHLLGFPCH